MPNEIRQTVFFDQSPREVWDCLTTPEILAQWLAPTDIKPIAGHTFRFMDKTGKYIDCEVLEAQPFTRLVYSWQFPSGKEDKRFDSTVVWTLVLKGEGTELQLVHNSFALLEDFTAHNNGWNNCLSKLKGFLKQTDNAHTNA
jgi:uncharacterized protein YndB with AHSA1/START domain